MTQYSMTSFIAEEHFATPERERETSSKMALQGIFFTSPRLQKQYDTGTACQCDVL